jgi:sodium-coupled neutral amino acid transporter 11
MTTILNRNNNETPPPQRPPTSKPPRSPFFHPYTPQRTKNVAHVVVQIQQTPGGTKHRIIQEARQLRANQDPQESEAPVVVKEQTTGIVGCAANLINAILGSGIVGIPYAMSQSGWLAGCVLLGVCAILAEKTLRLLIATAKHAHTATYETVAEAAFGKLGFQFIAWNIFVVGYGAVISYMMIFKDTIPAALWGFTDDDQELQRQAILCLVSAAIMLPLSCQRDMANLAFTSRISVLLDLILVAMVLYNAPILSHRSRLDDSDQDDDDGSWMSLSRLADFWNNTHHHYPLVKWDTLPIGLGVFSFAFVCQHSAFLVAGSLERPTIPRWSVVTRITLTSCALVFLTCGVAGYLGYQTVGVHGNILNNLPSHARTANLARILLGTCMLFVYPMIAFVLRHVLITLLFKGRLAHEGNQDSLLLQRSDRRIGLSTVLYLMAVIPAALCKDLGMVLAITGAIGCSCLSLIGPGAIYLAIHGERFLQLIQDSWWLQKWYDHSSCKVQNLNSTNDNSGSGAGGAIVEVKHPRNKPKNKVDIKTQPTETTPLLVDVEKQAGSKTKQVALGESKSDSNEEQAETDTDGWEFVLLGLQTLLAWTLLMPLWCRIASFGSSNLEDHMHDQALKSPYPLRIGNVEYKRTDVNTTVRSPRIIARSPVSMTPTDNDNSPRFELLGLNRTHSDVIPGARSSSLRDVTKADDPAAAVQQQRLSLFLADHRPPKSLGTTSPKHLLVRSSNPSSNKNSQMVSINQEIGQRLMAAEQQKKLQTAAAASAVLISDELLEPDPQENPTAYDFVVAIGLCIFGTVAMASGLWSLGQ